ncbi:MAG: hypothetical protein QM775_28435 [Pirellulales bacterium]
MDGLADVDRQIIREIITGYFELFDNKACTRDSIYHEVMIDPDMPKVADKISHVIRVFDKLVATGRIVSAGGEGKSERFRIKQ